MSDILVVKETTETTSRIVKVPDYQPQLDNIEQLKAAKHIAAIEAEKTVEILSGSIIEQIAAYLWELFKPLLAYCEAHDINVPGDIRWGANGWRLLPRQESGHHRADKIQFDYIYKDNSECFWIEFGTNGYTIHDDQLTTERIRDLAYRWPDFKQYCKQRLDEVTNEFKYEEEKQIRYNEDVIKTLSNFEL